MTTVGEVMSRNLLTVEPTTGLSEAAARMSDRGVGAALVLSGESVSGRRLAAFGGRTPVHGLDATRRARTSQS